MAGNVYQGPLCINSCSSDEVPKKTLQDEAYYMTEDNNVLEERSIVNNLDCTILHQQTSPLHKWKFKKKQDLQPLINIGYCRYMTTSTKAITATLFTTDTTSPLLSYYRHYFTII